MSVLPCPGVSACPAPRAPAVRSDTRSTSGVQVGRSEDRGRSPTLTPPGTEATAGAATDDRWGGGDAVSRRATGTTDPASGTASGMSRAGSAAPPGVATDRDRGVGQGLRQEVRRVGRQAGRDARRPQRRAVDRPRQRHARSLGHDLAPAEAVRERRIGEVDARAGAPSGASSDAAKPHTIRIVDRPPTPGGKRQPGLVEGRAPRRRRRRSAPGRAERPRRPVRARPRSRRRRRRRRRRCRSRCRAWKVGISAWSMTTSRRTRSGSTRMPA